MPHAISKSEILRSNLLGSFKQVRWAIGLRRDFMNAATPSERPILEEILENREEASWWIDHRRMTVADLIRAYADERDGFRGSSDEAMVLACTGEDRW